MSKNETITFTDAWVKDLTRPLAGRGYYRDARENGLGLYTTPNGAKTFYLRKRIKGRDERIVIGSAELLSVEKARAKARIIKEQIAEGLDPVAEKRKAIFSKLTLGAHCKDYMNIYSKLHNKSWKHDERDINRFFSPWFHRRMCDITRFEVQKLYQRICEENGMFQANRTLERLSSIYNKAIEWGWQGDNPAKKIKTYREKPRERFIQPEEMPYLIRSLNNELNTTARDYFRILLLTGVRKTNALMMRWDQINWQRETWRIPETKNGESTLLPLLERTIEILKERELHANSEWVFPSELDRGKHFINTKRVWKRIIQRATIYFWSEDENLLPIIETCRATLYDKTMVGYLMKLIKEKAAKDNIVLPIGLMDIRLHDIRRTFGSYQAINGSNLMVIGRSLGHKCTKSTLVYARLSLDPVRASIKQATDVMHGV